MARPKTNREDIRNIEHYCFAMVSRESGRTKIKQEKREIIEISLDEQLELNDSFFEVNFGVNLNDEFYSQICAENDRFAWIQEIEDLKLYEAVLSLNAKEKLLISYAWNEGYTQTEIAELMNISQQMISKKLGAISRKIKKYFMKGL